MSIFANKLKQPSSFASYHIKPRLYLSPSTLELLTLGLLLTFQSCGIDVEDPTPPSPPQWVEKSLPEEWPERGIDAHESGGIYMEWEPSTEENIVAYNVYRAEYYSELDSLGEYELLSVLEVGPLNDLNYIDNLSSIRVRYNYKLKAEDSAGNLSTFSDSLGYSLLPPLNTETMSPNGNRDTLDHTRSLTWAYSYQTEMEDFCITILTQDNSLVIRKQISPRDYVSAQETWHIPESLGLESYKNYKWRVDMGAQYIRNTETLGSESSWAPFLYISD